MPEGQVNPLNYGERGSTMQRKAAGFASFVKFTTVIFISYALLTASGYAEVETVVPTSEEASRYVKVSRATMGTEVVLLVYAPSAESSLEEMRYMTDAAFDAVVSMEQRVSTWIPTSFTSHINHDAAQAPVKTSDELVGLIANAKRLYAATGGVFDITVGPLLELWGFYKKQGHFPSEAEMETALKEVGLDKVQLDEKAGTVHFLQKNMRLDFGGIAKGLSLDYAAEVLKEHGVKNAILHAGTSTVVAMGAPPGENGWTVRIRAPYNDNDGEYVDEVQIRDASLSTSSSSERFLELNGKKYSHIFDPRTGMPVEGVLSATAIAPTGLDSDALSTAFFVMGVANTRAYCKAHPQVRAILVVEKEGKPTPVRINF